MSSVVFATLAIASLSGVTSAQPRTEAQPAGKITPSELLAKKDQLTNTPVKVEGVLVNQGTNFFTDLQVVLKDGDGQHVSGVRVQPWLPTELPPSPRGGQPSRATLSDYLGKRIVVEGMLTDSVVQNVGQTKVLRVDKVQIVE